MVAKVRVPEAVLDGLTAIRESGFADLRDIPLAMDFLTRWGEDEAAKWVWTHQRQYHEGIARGFEAERIQMQAI
ncbi:MAG: hypothetical protein ACUVWR_14465 [Anaerolineae bacterium]